MTTLLAECGDIDVARHGDGLGRDVEMDLSTCVNRYGPAPAAVSALRRIPPATIVLHPHDAAERMVDLYRWATDVRYGTMIAGRGVGEFIWAMAREVEHHLVRIPVPTRPDYLRAFPGCGFTFAAERVSPIERLDAALDGGRVVIVSNPHAPTGGHWHPDDLVAVAASRPESILVVDESYVDFMPHPSSSSVIGCDVPNIVVLQSTTAFYGIAATRTGIAWCADAEVLSWLFGRREDPGLSGVDVHASCAAVRDTRWADNVRRQMLDDSAWLAEILGGIDGFEVHANANVHFQYGSGDRATEVADALAHWGIAVRVLGDAHGMPSDALRIAAPRVDERRRFAAAIRELSEAGA
jgi:histidinol-phosphate aminotransferase